EFRNQCGRQINLAFGSFGLSHPVTPASAAAADTEDRAAKVHVAPFQTQGLTGAQTGEQQRSQKGAFGAWRGRAQKRLSFPGAEGVDRRARLAQAAYQTRGIGRNQALL